MNRRASFEPVLKGSGRAIDVEDVLAVSPVLVARSASIRWLAVACPFTSSSRILARVCGSMSITAGAGGVRLLIAVANRGIGLILSYLFPF